MNFGTIRMKMKKDLREILAITKELYPEEDTPRKVVSIITESGKTSRKDIKELFQTLLKDSNVR